MQKENNKVIPENTNVMSTVDKLCQMQQGGSMEMCPDAGSPGVDGWQWHKPGLPGVLQGPHCWKLK